MQFYIHTVILSGKSVYLLRQICDYTRIKDNHHTSFKCVFILSFSPPEKQIQSDTKKREHLKNPTKIEEIQEKNFIDRN